MYFSNVHPFLPIIHKPRLMVSMSSQAHPVSQAVLFSIYALASRHMEHTRPKAHGCYQRAKQLTQQNLSSPNMDTLVSLLLQFVYEIGFSNQSATAMTTAGSALFLSVSFRLAQMDAVGVHSENMRTLKRQNRWIDAPADWVESEGRRRVFLMAFSAAKWLATIRSVEFGIPLKNVRVRLPVSDEVWFAEVSI